MEVEIQNIPYFKFLIEPQCGNKATEILELVDGGFTHYLELCSKELKSTIVPKNQL